MNRKIKISVLTSLYNCEAFLPNYLAALERIEGKDIIEVLLLHNAPKKTELEIINGFLSGKDYATHIVIPERESLYRTWNRGIRLAKGEYVTVWNVDDVRFPNSVLKQAEILDKNPEAAIAYGDIWVSKNYGECSGFRTDSPVDNHNKDFFKQYHISCFQMWRKSIHETIGYYDEQLKCVADFDFQIRAALHYPFVKTDSLLGIYLEDQPHKLSANGLSDMERNIIYLRYGAYQHLNFSELKRSKKQYKQNKLLFFDEWYDLTEPTPFSFGYKMKGLSIAAFCSAFKLIKQIIKISLEMKSMKNQKVNRRQKNIRDMEWKSIEDQLKKVEGNFLDIGAGTGYAMYKAESLGFEVHGIEPCFNEHGVVDPHLEKVTNKIQQGYAEQIHFPDHFFQVVYASHSLEHFQDIKKGLSEMSRVLAKDGLAIIIVPTGLMAFVSLISQYIFLTHRRIARFLMKEFTLKNFRHIFLPNAHGSQNATVVGEIFAFRVKNWEKLVKQYFEINRIIMPCLYPYPDFPQIFPYIRNNRVSSSAIFICSKKIC